MLGNPDRSHAGATTAMRDAESLVQIEMADIGPDIAGRAETDLSVHVRSVHVDLSPRLVDQSTDLLDAGLEDPVGGRVRDHEGRETITMLSDLRLQICEVDIPIVAGNTDDLHAGHGGAGRIGTVRRGRYETDFTMVVTSRAVVGTDHEQAGILSL